MMAQEGSAQAQGSWSRRGSAAIAGLAALLATLAGSTPAAVEPVRLLSVTAHGPAVVIEATDPVAYTVNRPDAVTLVVDLRNAVVADAITRIEPRGPVTAVRLEQTKAADGLGVARVRIALGRAAEYRVKSSRNSIRVELAGDAAPAVSKVAAPVTQPATAKASAPVVQPVVAKASVPVAAVTPAESKREPKAAAVTAPRPASNVAPAVPGVSKGPAAGGTAAGTAGPTSEARSRQDAALARLGAETISLEQAIANGAPLTPRDEVLPGGAMAALKVRSQTAAPAAAKQSAAPAQPPVPPPAAPPAEPPAATSPVLQGPQSQQISSGDTKKYVGHPISMDFQGVDLRSVLRTFAEISGLNMVIDPDVQGTVDIVLTDVPWDQALEVILRGNALDYTVDGTIVRIARIETLRREQDGRTQLAQSAANAGALAVRTYTLSYAKADQAAPLVKSSVLSPRGNVQIDVRTNTLIITDLPVRLDTVQQLLGTIDRAEPQVEIEARIITTTRDYARALGLQWGFNGRVDSAIGNTTGLAFPNNGSLGGRLGQQGPIGTDPRAQPLDRAGTAVDMPFVSDFSPTSAIGLALGSINGALNLDVALSALERTGKGRILSTPRVTTQNNVDAEITQGVQIPIQVEANNTVTTTYKDAALTLKVTPQITAANTVIMQITLENSAPGAQTPDGGLSIDTQRAITRVQVNDGMTTVIGGIFVSREQTVNSRTPLLYRIPFLGWLFKNDSQTDTSRELLIFITPRIQKG
jgi:type IV pilus assembly protein PilQ